MNDKKHMLDLLKDEFTRWKDLLDGMSEAQITDPHLPSNSSVKDVIAHLWAWQQVSVARMEAAQANMEPVLPTWLGGSDPESEEELDLFNARIYQAYREKPWSSVHRGWRDNFRRFLELGEAAPEEDMLETGKYPWLKGDALIAVLQGSYEHHEEHLESVLAKLPQNSSMH